MKSQYITIFASLAVIAAAKPHHNAHRHASALLKRYPQPDRVSNAPGPVETVILYELNGRLISEEEARLGIANGTLMWGTDGTLSTSTVRPIVLPTVAPATTQQKPTFTTKEILQVGTQKPAPPPQATPVVVAPSAPSIPVAASPPDSSTKSPSDLVDKNGYCAECDNEFPNGKIPCSKFPYGYGAMPLTYEGLGGWSGIQDPGYRGGDGFDYIRTVVKGSCSDGSCCSKGSYCSYGCPNPYLKLSFPKKQGRTGQTVGGLYCNNDGMLEMADGSIGKTLCGSGSKRMTVRVQNRLSQPVSICRTDYPGTESMTFPLTVGPGETGYLANPDLSKYFFWDGKPTSAHYYVNKQGVPESEACTWGEEGQARGNWSPAIFGTSFDDISSRVGYSSLKQNELNMKDRLDYSITFTGDGIVNPCKYSKATGKYGQGDRWFDSIQDGCTLHKAGVKDGGSLTLVLTDD